MNQYMAQWSPDGRWIAYSSNEATGVNRPELYVVPYPGPGDKVRVSTQGGTAARWRSDGKELFYANAGTIFVASVDGTDSRFEVQETRRLLTRPNTGPISFNVSPDGQRILMRTPVEPDAPQAITVVVNWTDSMP
jgi:Tol biopolymer transport system component